MAGLLPSKFIKRTFDLLVALSAILLLWPVILIVALLVRIYLGNPIVFYQQRPGLHGKPFYIYKFRTMSLTCGENGELLPDQQRMTKLGYFLRNCSLDELPQLFNVLKGELSLVGPRPLLMEYLPLYSFEQARRHEVRPGITGWAQVNGRNALSWEERFKLDVWYVDNISLALDLKIIWMTCIKVLKRDGISEKNQSTMTKFKGSNLE